MKTAKDRAGGLAKSRRRIEVQPLAGSIGAEIIGVDLGGELDDDTIAAIRQALLEYIVIFFRDQETTPERRVAFGRRFGELYRYPDYRTWEARIGTHADYPEIIELRKEPEDRRNIGNRWHSDVTFHECPPMGSILYALEVPRSAAIRYSRTSTSRSRRCPRGCAPCLRNFARSTTMRMWFIPTLIPRHFWRDAPPCRRIQRGH